MRSAAVGMALALLVANSAVAVADPVAAQPGTPCASTLSDVMTQPPDANMPLVCRSDRWQTVTMPQPPNDRWLSFGPAMTLHGQGQRNPNVTSGAWTATPLDADSQCRAEQTAVVEPGVVGPPQVTESPRGQPLSFQMVPRLFSIGMSGYCLWTRTG